MITHRPVEAIPLFIKIDRQPPATDPDTNEQLKLIQVKSSANPIVIENSKLGGWIS